MKLFTSGVLLSAVLLFSCQSRSKDPAYGPPDVVVREWQRLVDNNHFKEAMKMSTAVTRERLDAYARAFEGEKAEVSTKFVSISCREEGNEAFCKCVMQAESGAGTYEDEVHLLKQDDRWLIEMEGFVEEDEDMEPGSEESKGDL